MSNDTTKIGKIGNSPLSLGRFSYGFEHIAIRDFDGFSSLEIGSFCSISSAVTIFLSGNHRADWVTTFPFGRIYNDELQCEEIENTVTTNGDVIVGHDVWIGHGVTIMSGITVGTGAILAANAHVIKDVAPYEIVGGNPAKHIKMRFSDDIIEKLLILKWWDLPLSDIRNIYKQLLAKPTIQILDELILQYR